MANLKNVIYLSNEDYETLVSTGTVTIDGETLTYDENNVYITPDKLASTTEDGLMSAVDKSKLDNIESGAQVNVQSDWNQTDTGSDDYIKNKPEVDTDFSLTSTNALQNKVISEKLEYIDYALTHIKYKLFGVTTLSEIDYKVDYATIYPIPETLSDDDGTHRIVYSDTQLKEVEGNSVAFNQLAKNGNFANGTTEWYAVASNGTISASDNVLTYTMTTAGAYNYSNAISQYAGLHFIAGRKYLISAQVKSSKSFGINVGLTRGTPTSQTNYTIQTTNNWQTAHCIGTVNDISGTQTKYSHEIQIYVDMRNAEVGDTYQVRNCMAFDLTLMFGSGNEPTSIDDARLTKLLSQYNEYNEGEIKSTVIKGVKVNGYNLFDGELEQGYYDTATEPIIIRNDNNYICSKEKIRVVAGRTYTLETDDDIFALGLNAIYIGFADENGKHISWNSNSVSKSITFTIPNNAYWCYFEYLKSSGISVPSLNKCCFHLTGSRTGYAPYKEPRIIAIPQTKLPSAGSVHDTIKIVEGNIVAGQQRYNMVYVSKVASDDLGTLNWDVGTSYNAYAQLPSAKKVSSSVLSNMLCSNYKVYKEDDITAQTKGISFANVLIIKDTSLDGKTAEEIKTAMSNVIINYEKAEPTETTLATDLTFEEVSAIIEQGGSIETVFEIVPPNLKTAFVVNKVIVS